jgi:hypothetical protein
MADWPIQLVTLTSTVLQLVPAGATALMVPVPVFTVKLVAGTPPKVTAVTSEIRGSGFGGVPTKFVPEIVTAVPPAASPVFGVTPVTVGAAV